MASFSEQNINYGARHLHDLTTAQDPIPNINHSARHPHVYQAASWTTARRVEAKVESHCGELFPGVGFIVTNLVVDSRAVVRFCTKRGTAEQWIKGGNQATAGVRVGEVLVAGAEKTESPGFRVLRPVNAAPRGEEDGSRRMRADHGGSQEGKWLTTRLTLGAKTGIPHEVASEW